MKASRLLVLAVAVLGMGGCQTLTEELPTQAPAAGLPPMPILPPVVQPAPLPQPQPPSGGAPVPPSNPGPPPPTGGGGGGGGTPPGQVPNNNSAVAKVGAKVYFLECNGQEVPGSEFATQAQVGCRVHFDCTPKDANNNPTQSQGFPSWSFNPGSIVAGGNPSDFTPTVTATGTGNLTAFVVIDGIRSNDVNIQFVN